MIMFSEAHWERRMKSITHYRERYEALHGTSAPAMLTADFTFCHEDGDYAREVAEQCLVTYLQSLLEHYDLMGNHLDEMKGYQGYGRQAAKLREIGFDKFVDGFLAANAYGTPAEMLERFRERRSTIGPYQLATCFRYGGMKIEDATRSMQLFAQKVLPELKSWD